MLDDFIVERREPRFVLSGLEVLESIAFRCINLSL